MTHQYRLDDGRQTLVLAAQNDRLPEVVYWGATLPATEDLTTLQDAHMIDVTGGMLDENPPLSICPEATRSFPGQPGLIVRDSDQNGALKLVYEDADNGLSLTFDFAVDPETHIITAQTTLDATRPVHLHWLAAPVLPAPQQSDEMIDVSGRWCGEFQLNRTAWSAGMRYRENRTGRTGHEHFPGLLIPTTGATNTRGECYGFHYGWSGGHRMLAEELQDGRRQVQWGHAARMETEPQTQFKTAPLYISYSSSGLNGCAVVHYNCWEAVYFDHKLPVLKDIADRAAKLGAERFVLDDGWFGQRDDDTRSLSDWTGGSSQR